MSTYFNKGNPVLIGSLTPNSKATKSLAKLPNSKILSHTKLPPISNQNTTQNTSLLTSNSAKNSFHKPTFLSSNNSHSRNFYSTSSLDLVSPGSLSDNEKLSNNTNNAINIGPSNNENSGPGDRHGYGQYSDIKPSLSANSNYLKQGALSNLNGNSRQNNVLLNKNPSTNSANPYLSNIQGRENRESPTATLSSNINVPGRPRLELVEPNEGDDHGYSEITKELDKMLEGSSKTMKKNVPNLPLGGIITTSSQTTKNSTSNKVELSAVTSHNNTLNSQLTPSGNGLIGRKFFQQSNRKAHHFSMNSRTNAGASLSDSKHNVSASVAIPSGNLANNEIYISAEDIPKIETSKGSSQKNGIIKAYAANTHQGLVRNYNEDRVSIILNIMKPPNKEGNEWPTSSFFGIYDGHGGVKCAEFLRDNLHQYVIKDKNFPQNPRLAIRRGFEQAEKTFIEMAQGKNGELDKSGSCAVVILIVDDICYIANVGDSRAVLSCEGGDKIFPLSKDHKPGTDEEQKRIISNGGKIYQSQIQTPSMGGFPPKIILGPFRVMPGRLSVSRTFGDAEAKLVKYGGNPNVIIAEPDIKSFKITDDKDFLILGCDGIFDKLSNKEVIKSIWEVMPQTGRFKNIHEFAARSVENLIRESMIRRSLDNVTVVMICFKNLKKVLFPKSPETGKNMMNQAADRKLRNAQLFKEMQLIEYKYSPDNPNEPSDYDNDLYESASKGKPGSNSKDLMLSSGKSGGSHHLSPRNRK